MSQDPIDHDLLTRIFQDRYRELLEGMPEGEPTWVTSGGRAGGIYGLLDGLSAEQASRPAPGGSTVAAHAEHLRWAIAMVNNYFRGETGGAEWSESWLVSAVDEAAWKELRAALREEGRALLDHIATQHRWTEEFAINGALASLGHTAYHLGALRQMAKAAGDGG